MPEETHGFLFLAILLSRKPFFYLNCIFVFSLESDCRFMGALYFRKYSCHEPVSKTMDSIAKNDADTFSSILRNNYFDCRDKKMAFAVS